MKATNTEQKPRVQIPIRITHSLNKRFTDISNATLIPRSKLTRIGLELLFHNIETRGITSVLNELEEV